MDSEKRSETIVVNEQKFNQAVENAKKRLSLDAKGAGIEVSNAIDLYTDHPEAKRAGEIQTQVEPLGNPGAGGYRPKRLN